MNTLSADQFDRAIAGDRPVLVDFYADWCGPCRALTPALEALARNFEGRADVIKVDVDAESELAARFGVRALPTLLLFSRGRVVEQFVGLTSEKVLAAAIEAELSSIAA